MSLIDISAPLRPGMPVWPGDSETDVASTWSIGPGCPVNVSRIVLSSHAGTHADAPLHVAADGEPIDALDLSAYVGPCLVVDVRGPGPLVPPAVLDGLPSRVERVLFRQYDRHPAVWDPGLRGLDPELVAGLADRGCRLVGMDAASVDPADSKTLDAHHALRRAGILILEGLVLEHVPPGPYELIALPLKIAGCDAAPVRAVLRPLPRSAA